MKEWKSLAKPLEELCGRYNIKNAYANFITLPYHLMLNRGFHFQLI
jgi:hypothetical protein